MTVQFDPAWSRLATDYTGSDDMLLYLPRTGSVAGRIPMIYAHGFGGGATYTAYRDITLAADDLRPIAGIGTPVAVPDLAGASTWGIDAAHTAVGTTVTWLGANLGCRTDKIALAGESMGALSVLNWAWRNPTKVACLWLRVPVVDLAAFYYANQATFGGAIDSAWGGSSAFLAGLPTHDPAHANQTATLAGLADRAKIWLATADEFIAENVVRAFANRVGWPVSTVPGNHAAGFTTPVADTTDFVIQALRRSS